MSIELIRIDDRLVHGQIVQGWLKVIDIDKIVVVSDAVAGDSIQQMFLFMAVPNTIDLEIKNVDDAASAMLAGNYDKPRTMMLFTNPTDVLRMVEKGAAFKSINVGGMHFSNGKKQLLCNLSVDENDIDALCRIRGKGIEIEGRVLPADERVDIYPIVEKERKK